MFSSRLCQDVIVCSNTSTYNKSNTISLEYLIYQFKERFKLLLPEEKYTLTNSSIKAWIEQNKIQNFILWLDEVMTMARSVNILIDGYFVE